MLTFSRANSKLKVLQAATGLKVYSFDIPAGHTCPMASLCKSYVDYNTGKIVDEGDFRCYAASAEAQYKRVKEMRRRNLDHLRQDGIRWGDIPANAGIIRIHSSGDFYNVRYFQDWLTIARNLPSVIFYGYTKRADFLIEYGRQMPSNFRLTYSYGGKLDALAESANLPTCYVWTGGELRAPLACETDKNDDFELIMDGKSFSLRVHGTQPKGFKKPGERPAKPGSN